MIKITKLSQVKKEKIIYENEGQILSFLHTGNVCFYDSYSTKGFEIEIDGIKYPSVRHAVLSFKTRAKEVRRKIAEIQFPSDLKEYEMSITPPRWWHPRFVLEIMESITLRKFEENPEFAQKLEATGDKELLDNRDKSEGKYDIQEVAWMVNYLGVILMKVRNTLRKQKAP